MSKRTRIQERKRRIMRLHTYIIGEKEVEKEYLIAQFCIQEGVRPQVANGYLDLILKTQPEIFLGENKYGTATIYYKPHEPK